ncbi:MAG: DUF2807 domain-containing protein, partial [Bacteroidetes bacterium]|nr:DUF2807 domain-containing protein [Bacteroidota bacterium]
MIAALYVVLFILIIVSGTQKVMASENNKALTVLNEKTPIYNIFAKGNVRVFISQGEEQEIKVGNNYYAQNALTQVEGGTLRISSFEKEKLTVWVTVKDLRSIEAYDHALVYSLNQFRAIDFKVTLGNQAVAVLDVQAFDLTTDISDTSRLKLKGSTEFHQIVAHNSSNIDVTKFAAQTEELKLYDDSSITLGNSKNSKTFETKVVAQKLDEVEEIFSLQ